MQAVLILIADWLDLHALPILARAKAHPPAKSAGRVGQPPFWEFAEEWSSRK